MYLTPSKFPNTLWSFMFVEITNSVYLVYIYFELVKIYYLFVFCPYAAVVYGTDFKKF